MTDYDGLNGLIDEIAEAAIDWRMQIMQWGKQGDGWIISGLGSFWECDRQGNVKLNGESQPDPYYPEMMNNWRTNVREVLEPWTELPDPGWLDWRIDAMRTQMNSLLDPSELEAGDLDPDEAGVPTVGNGDLHSARGTIDTKLGNMEGYAAAAMYDNLVSKMDDVMRGAFVAAAVLGQHLTGQQAIIKEAREDITALFNAMYEVMDNKGLVGGDTISLGLVGAVIGVAGSFATGGLATAIGILGAGVGLADELIPEGDPPNPIEVSLAGYDPDESWGLMVDALTTANEQFTDQERDLATRSRNARDIVSGSSVFDLSKLAGEGTDPGVLATAGDIVHIDQGGLKYIAEVSIVTASHSLDRTRYDIEDIDPGYALTRPASIGYASDGINGPWSGLRDALVTAIGGTSGELWEMRAAVIEILHKFGVTDIEQAERYREVEYSVGGSCYGY